MDISSGRPDSENPNSEGSNLPTEEPHSQSMKVQTSLELASCYDRLFSNASYPEVPSGSLSPDTRDNQAKKPLTPYMKKLIDRFNNHYSGIYAGLHGSNRYHPAITAPYQKVIGKSSFFTPKDYRLLTEFLSPNPVVPIDQQKQRSFVVATMESLLAHYVGELAVPENSRWFTKKQARLLFQTFLRKATPGANADNIYGLALDGKPSKISYEKTLDTIISPLLATIERHIDMMSDEQHLNLLSGSVPLESLDEKQQKILAEYERVGRETGTWKRYLDYALYDLGLTCSDFIGPIVDVVQKGSEKDIGYLIGYLCEDSLLSHYYKSIAARGGGLAGAICTQRSLGNDFSYVGPKNKKLDRIRDYNKKVMTKGSFDTKELVPMKGFAVYYDYLKASREQFPHTHSNLVGDLPDSKTYAEYSNNRFYEAVRAFNILIDLGLREDPTIRKSSFTE